MACGHSENSHGKETLIQPFYFHLDLKQQVYYQKVDMKNRNASVNVWEIEMVR